MPVEQRRFARVGVADQRNDGIRHASLRLSRCSARVRFLTPLEIELDARDAFADQPAVGFDLGFARAAKKAKAAALALKMRP